MAIARKLRHLGRHARVLALVAALLSAVMAEVMVRTGTGERFEYLYSDFWHQLAGQRHAPEHTALVMIDEDILSGRTDAKIIDPNIPLVFWTPYFATAIKTLRSVGVRGVAIDFLFSASPESWLQTLRLESTDAFRNYDRNFREQVNLGNVLLAGFCFDACLTAENFALPNPDYLLALPDMDMTAYVGLANLRQDIDKKTRHFSMAAAADEAGREGLPRLALASLAAAQAAQQDVRGAAFAFGGRTIPPKAELPIAFIGPPGTFHPVSFEKLLLPNAHEHPEVKALAGKIVVLGASFASSNDVHATAYGADNMMLGAEIQANIVETLLAGRFIDDTGPAARLLAFLLTFGVLALIGVRLNPWRAVILVTLAMAGSAAVAYGLFKAGVLFPVARLHMGMAFVLVSLALLRLTREERERARIGTLFGRYVSDQVVSAMLASPDLPELGGQARRISVLFSDIRNFTTISEKLSAREVVEMLNTYFERACAVLLAEGATIDKFIGDAIMAEFGAPLAQDDHALRAIRAAVALHQVAVEFRDWMAARFPDRGLPEFAIGIGIHSGEAVIGNIGSSKRMEYTAIGDTVNIASRLEGKTKDTGCAILASSEAVASAGASVSTGALHTLKVKGRDQPVDAYEIVDVTTK